MQLKCRGASVLRLFAVLNTKRTLNVVKKGRESMKLIMLVRVLYCL